MDDMVDGVPELTRAHFEEAYQTARASVDAATLQRYKDFAEKMSANPQSGQGNSSQAPGLAWPNYQVSQMKPAEDDDFYD